MSDLIERQAAIDLIKNDAFWVQYAWGGRGHKPEMEMVDDLVESIIKQMKESVMSRLKQMPSAQPEVVRCKDCKHRPTVDEDGDLKFPTYKCPCQCEDYWYSWMPEDDWFCANGERKIRNDETNYRKE